MVSPPPFLYNIAAEEALEKVLEVGLGVKVGTQVNISAFADDVVMVTEHLEDLKILTKVFIK